MKFVIFLCSILALAKFTRGFLNIEELEDMKYAVDITGTPLNSNDINLREGVPMTSQSGQKYFCKLPEVAIQSQNDIEKIEDKPTLPPPLPSLLKPLYDQKDCLTKVKGWWTYELCPTRSIRQYHIEADESKGSLLTLGFYSHEFDWSNETDDAYEQHKSRRYHSQTYVNGTICDLTKKPRQVNVRYKCDANSLETYIEHVDEPFTCSYIITVRTPLICSHPNTRPPPSKKPHDITCQPILPPQDYQMYQDHIEKYPEETNDATTSTTKGGVPGVSKMYVYYTSVDNDGNVKPLSMQMIDMSDKSQPTMTTEKIKKTQHVFNKKYRSRFHEVMEEALKKSEKQLGIDSASISKDLKAFQEQAKDALPFLLSKLGKDSFDLSKEIEEMLQKRELAAETLEKNMKLYKDVAIKLMETSVKNENKLLKLEDAEKVVLLQKVVQIIANQNPTADIAREVHTLVSQYLLTAAMLLGSDGTDDEDDAAALYVDVTINRNGHLAAADKKLEKELSKIGLGDGNLEAPGDDDQHWWNSQGQMFKDLIFNMFNPISPVAELSKNNDAISWKGGEESKKVEESKHSAQTLGYNFNLKEKLVVKPPQEDQEEEEEDNQPKE